MDKPSKSELSLSAAPTGRGRHRRAKPSGLQTPPAMLNAKPEVQKKNDWSKEPPTERLQIANAALREALARFQSLGCVLYTKNVDGSAVIRLAGMAFVKPGSNDPTLQLITTAPPVAPIVVAAPPPPFPQRGGEGN